MPSSSNTPHPLHPSHLNPRVQEQAEAGAVASTNNQIPPHGTGKDKGKVHDRSNPGDAHPLASTSSHPHSTAAAPYHPHSTAAASFHPFPSGSRPASPPTSGFHLPSFHIPRVGSLGRTASSSTFSAHVNDHSDNHIYFSSAFSSALPSANNSATNLPETLNLPQAPPSLNYNTITDIQNRNAGASSSTSMGFRDRDRREREHKDRHHDSHSKEKTHLDIILDAPFLTLRGTGPDVEPTTLSGHVALFLTEATSVKEITLQFRGKAKIPMPASESVINSGTSITYVVCNHDWSFLEGDKRHARTLKAGRHFFPFHLEIGGTLPSSISTSALGGANVAYKLRALATRPGLLGSLHHTLQAVAPVTILRAFTPEALEYQQTLEIENTWPDKIMYSLMLPHKAWAAGDEVAAAVKFIPLRKGVRVMEVETALWETVKVYARSGGQEETRKICSVKHGIVGGRAVEIDWEDGDGVVAGGRSGSTAGSGTQERRGISSRPPSTHHSAPTALSDLTQLSSEPANYQSNVTSSSYSAPGHQNSTNNRNRNSHDEEGGYENADVVTYVKLRIPLSAGAPPGGMNPVASLPGTPAGDNTSSYSGAPPLFNANGSVFHPKDKDQDQSALVPTPSHALDPIAVSHRVRWSILIRNQDGHTSELRCSLPVIILDSRVLEEARGISIPTRRLMMGSVGLRINGEEGRQRRRQQRAQRHGSTDFHAYGDDDWSGDEDDDSNDFNLGFPRTTDDGSGAHVIGGNSSSPNAPTGTVVGMHAGDDDRELPSYTAHVRDRVANMFLPEAVTMRVSNPWVGRVGPVTTPGGTVSTPPPGGTTQQLEDVAHTADSSGRNSTTDLPQITSLADAVHSIMSSNSTPGGVSAGASQPQSQVNSPSHRAQHHLPPVQGHADDLTPLDWVNSELLLSLSDEPVRRLAGSNPGTPGSAGAAAALTAAGLGIESGMLAYTSPTTGASSAPGTGSASGSSHQSLVESHVHLPNASSVRTPPPQPHYIASAHGGSGPATTGRRTGSRWGSRAGSRANSPERGPSSAGGSRRPSAETSRPVSRPVSPAVGGFGGLAMSMSLAHATPSTSDTPSSTRSRSRVNSTTSQGHLTLPAVPGLTSDGTLLSPSGSSGGSSPSASGFFPPQGSGGQPLSHPASAVDAQTSVDKHDKSHGHGGRNLHSLFKATMKPFSALTHRHHIHGHDRDKEKEARAHGHVMHAQRRGQHHSGESSREGSPVDTNEEANTNTRGAPTSITIPSNPYAIQSAPALHNGSSIPPLHSPLPHSALSSPGFVQPVPLISPVHSPGPYSSYSTNSQFATQMLNTPASIAGPAILHRAFTEVPDYSIASRGFLGGVPPLDSMRGLPSYEEAARESRRPGLHSRAGSEPALPAVQPTTPETTVSNVEVEDV